jgi:hypothetical protein
MPTKNKEISEEKNTDQETREKRPLEVGEGSIGGFLKRGDKTSYDEKVKMAKETRKGTYGEGNNTGRRKQHGEKETTRGEGNNTGRRKQHGEKETTRGEGNTGRRKHHRETLKTRGEKRKKGCKRDGNKRERNRR